MANQYNVAQPEFFHVGGESATLESIAAECGDRIADGLELVLHGLPATNGIKTTVRFFDRTGRLTKLAQEYEALGEQRASLLLAFTGAHWVKRALLDMKSRRNARRAIELKKSILATATKELRTAIDAGDPLLIEQSNRSFRPMQPNEAHELAEAVGTSKDVWLFIFEPNSLFADTNALIASAM